MKKKVLSIAAAVMVFMVFFAVPVFAGQSEVDTILAAMKSAGVPEAQIADATAWLNTNKDTLTPEKTYKIVGYLSEASKIANGVTDQSKLTAEQRGQIVLQAQGAAAVVGLEIKIDTKEGTAKVLDNGVVVSNVQVTPKSNNSGGGSEDKVVKAAGTMMDYTNVVMVSLVLAAMFGGAVVVGRVASKKSEGHA